MHQSRPLYSNYIKVVISIYVQAACFGISLLDTTRKNDANDILSKIKSVAHFISNIKFSGPQINDKEGHLTINKTIMEEF
jgi:hypothetical protein